MTRTRFAVLGSFGAYLARLARGLSRATRLAAVGLALGACARVPTPIAPGVGGSIGMPQFGVLTDGEMLPRDAPGIRWLRPNDRHWAAPRFVAALERVAAKVANARPGPPLVIGDLSVRTGGHLPEHMSHRTGHDADLLLFVETLQGAPAPSPGFVRFDADGLAWDETHQRFLRFDVARTWLLVKALVEDDDARVEWIFVHRTLQAMLVEWARARGEPPETILRAERLMLQPGPPAETHDDHLHVRVNCDSSELARGCEPTGPRRDWLSPLLSQPASTETSEDDATIALELLQPLAPVAATPGAPPGPTTGAGKSSGLAP